MRLKTSPFFISILVLVFFLGCKERSQSPKKEQMKIEKTAADILGNPEYQAISYGGYRSKSRDDQPSVAQIKQDLLLLHAMGIRVLRTYNVQLPHATNVLEAIRQIKSDDPTFEMYVMLGAWIDCLNAWTDLPPDHDRESPDNANEIERAVKIANKYPDIVKVLAVGNEAMIRWATSYYVQPEVILKWVNYLQDLKKQGKLSSDLWITSSDDYASWGGGDATYHTPDLEELMRSVDYISMHTYPFHNTHYNPEFWKVPEAHAEAPDLTKIEMAMERSLQFAQKQYDSVSNYMRSLGVNKPIHIGETGWASVSNGHYGSNGSKAADEYKQGLYHQLMRDWTTRNNISCFYFEAFNEQWKDARNSKGSENHFGLFTIDGKAKYPIWDLVDEGIFKGLKRDGKTIRKTYNGKKDSLLKDVLVPPLKSVVLN